MASRTELTDLGAAARNLLAYSWDLDVRDGYLVGAAISAVVTTFGSDPSASEALLRRVIEPEHVEQFGHEDLVALFEAPECFVTYAPDFLVECYGAAFGYNERSQEKTVMVPSRLLGLSSTKSQDYDFAQYRLGEAFPGFIARDPDHAVAALANVVWPYVLQRQYTSEPRVVPFTLAGKSLVMMTDNSSIWDSGPLSAGTASEAILDHFEQYLADIGQQNDKKQAEAMRSLLTRFELPACIWRRVINRAVEDPAVLGRCFADLLSEPALLAAIDVQEPLVRFMEVEFPLLPIAARRRIERAVWKLPKEYSTELSDYGDHARDLFLASMPTNMLVTAPAQNRKTTLTEERPDTTEQPNYTLGATWGEYTEEQALRHRGADLEHDATRTLFKEYEPLGKLADDHLNGEAPPRERARGVARAKRLSRALMEGAYDDADPVVQEQAWLGLARASGLVARSASALTERQGMAVRDVLLTAAHQPPHQTQVSVDAFDSSPLLHWSPTSEAAIGLCALMRDARFLDADAQETLLALVESPEPTTRWRLAEGIRLLGVTAPDLHRAVATHMAEHEQSMVVLDRLAHVIQQIIFKAPHAGLKLAEIVLYREQARSASRPGVLRTFATLLLADYAFRGSQPGQQLADVISDDLQQWSEPIGGILHALRTTVFDGATDRADDDATATRKRSIGMMRGWLAASEGVLIGLRELHDRPDSPWTDDERNLASAALGVAEAVAMQLYFASGVFGGGSDTRHADSVQRIRLYREANDLLHTLARIGLPKAVDQVIKVAEGCIDADPRGAFLLVADAVRGGKDFGYQFEPMAQRLVVEIVHRFLADRHELFLDDEDTQAALMDILDTFVSAGWPDARKLVYSLGETFR